MKNPYYRWLSNCLKANGRAKGAPLLLIVYSLTFVFLGLTVLASLYTGIPIAVFVRDPVIVMDGSPIIGVQSNLGVLIWLASASVCFFCNGLLRHNVSRVNVPAVDVSAVDVSAVDVSAVDVSAVAESYPTRQGLPPQSVADFFLWSGLITLWLTLDDMFLFHEYLPEIVPRISQESIYIVYGLVVIWHIIRFHRYIAQSEASGLALAALFFLGLSVFSDIVQDFWESPWRIFFEDGFKLLGIVSWSSYLTCTGFQVLKQKLN